MDNEWLQNSKQGVRERLELLKQLGYKVLFDELGRTYCTKVLNNINSTLSETEIQILAVGVQAFQGGFLQTSGNDEKYIEETKAGMDLFKNYISEYNSIIWKNVD